MKIQALFIAGLTIGLLAPISWGESLQLGGLSYDTLVPSGAGSPGIDAFDVANLTGAFKLPPDFPVSDSLTFQSAALTLTFADATQELINLGDIAPGFLLDGSGNPIVQVPGDQVFVAAELIAVLTPTTFTLADGTIFTASSASIDALLLPSSGSRLTVDVDQITIEISDSGALSVPEPPPAALLTLAFLCVLAAVRSGIAC